MAPTRTWTSSTTEVNRLMDHVVDVGRDEWTVFVRRRTSSPSRSRKLEQCGVALAGLGRAHHR